MNIFLLPSWYPSARSPMAGGFVLDQVRALASVRSGPGIVVGVWGHHDGALSLRDPADSWRALRWRLGASECWRECADGGRRWYEALAPRLSWTLGWARGGAGGLLRASRRNLDRAFERLGRIDLIHAHVGFPAGWIASVLGAERRIPYLLTEHMGPFPVRQLMHRGRPNDDLRQAFERAAAVVAVSPSLAAAIRDHGLPCTDVIPNVVDPGRFATAARTRPPPSPFVILSLGALTHGKGMDLLLDAFARWRPSPAEVRLHIAGDGPERAALVARAAHLGLGEHVRFLGRLRPDEVPQAMMQCHAFALASRHETFGVVLAEALTAGRPVLSTRCGGPQAIVGPEDGLLVEPESVSELADGLRELRELARSADGDAIQARAIARFGPEAVAAQLLQVYQRVLRA